MEAVVVHSDEVAPEELISGASVRTTLGPAAGCPRLIQRLVHLPRRAIATSTVEGAGELWHISRGEATLACTGQHLPLRERMGVFLPSGCSYRLENVGKKDLEVTVVVLPEGSAPGETNLRAAAFEESAVETTGDRHFRVLIGPSSGFGTATQFVGEIPPGRAPAHRHTYDEVVRVLDGSGVVHIGDEKRLIGPGSCIYLSPGTLHCLENTGVETLWVLGVFHPGGSPAAKEVATAG
jgi:mannose-6-phosphate isomerase-like protein (cupin superfamily)